MLQQCLFAVGLVRMARTAWSSTPTLDTSLNSGSSSWWRKTWNCSRRSRDSEPGNQSVQNTDVLFLCMHSVALWLSYVVHINEVTLRRAGFVLGWVTICGYTVFVFNQPLRPTQPGHPSMGRHNEYWRWSRPLLGKKRRVLHNSRPCYHDCLHTGLVG